MRETAIPRKTYTAHRQNQRHAILEAAEDVFIAKGIDVATIGEIATASGVTRATIYQYFANKQEIAWALFENVVAQWREDAERDALTANGCGADRIERFLLSALDFALCDPRQASFLAQFNILYSKERFSGRMTEVFHEGFGPRENFMIEILGHGLADGSLRPDLDIALALSAILNFSAAIQLRLGLLGTLVEVEYGMSNSRIFREMIRFYVDGMRVAHAPASLLQERDANTTER